mmetsp:Transcript_44831/g.103706  ORF Transcript_44831/g.103706 Transcript_44831/m.103706 type:complete len:282 (-) Transcript_44831:170-1015(-)
MFLHLHRQTLMFLRHLQLVRLLARPAKGFPSLPQLCGYASQTFAEFASQSFVSVWKSSGLCFSSVLATAARLPRSRRYRLRVEIQRPMQLSCPTLPALWSHPPHAWHHASSTSAQTLLFPAALLVGTQALQPATTLRDPFFQWPPSGVLAVQDRPRQRHGGHACSLAPSGLRFRFLSVRLASQTSFATWRCCQPETLRLRQRPRLSEASALPSFSVPAQTPPARLSSELAYPLRALTRQRPRHVHRPLSTQATALARRGCRRSLPPVQGRSHRGLPATLHR